jgi:AraC-like DNA-binding protein
MHRPIFLLHKTIMTPSLRLARPFIYHCEKNWSWNPGPLRDFDLWLVLRGCGELEISGHTHSVGLGAGFLFQPGDAPQGRHDPNNPLVVFACHFLPAAGRAVPPRRLEAGILHASLSEWELVRSSCETAVHAFDQGPTGRSLATALVGQLASQLLHARTRPDEKNDPLSELALKIRGEPSHPWNITAMSRHCRLSIPHFNRRFRQRFGFSPLRYLIRARVARAIALLRESDLPIAQVAESSGYADVFFFHRQFRQIAGVTPGAVRRGEATRLDD